MEFIYYINNNKNYNNIYKLLLHYFILHNLRAYNFYQILFFLLLENRVYDEFNIDE